jgi:hypothetical protein
LVNVHAFPEILDLDDAYFRYLFEYLNPCDRAIVVEVVVEIKPVVFCRASRKVWILLLLVADCANLVSTSYDDFVVKDFDFSDVCLMKVNGGGNSVLAFQSLARPVIILDLYSALDGPPLDLVSENEMDVVCALGFVRGGGRGRR